jgi:hypothetical protein
LRKDETAVLLAFRLAYEEAFRAKQFNELGAVETTTDELYDKLAIIGGIEIEDARLKEILAFLKRKGVIEIGERDPVERVIPLTILPGIEIVVPSVYVEQVRMAAEAVPPAAAPGAAAALAGEEPEEELEYGADDEEHEEHV